MGRSPRDVSLCALEAELLEGGENAKRLMLGRGDMLTLAAASALSGLSVHALSRRRRANLVLALPFGVGRRAYRYPAFQFENAVRDAMPALLALFGRNRVWQLCDFLLHSEPLLQGNMPLDLLRRGQLSDVLRAASAAALLEQGAH